MSDPSGRSIGPPETGGSVVDSDQPRERRTRVRTDFFKSSKFEKAETVRKAPAHETPATKTDRKSTL